jgi:hypothetical protein
VRRLVVGAVLAGLAAAALATPASAHDVLISSTPKAGSAVSAGPSQITFTFDAPVQHGENTIVVLGPNGTHWERHQQPVVLGDSVSTAVAPLGPAGVYTASYHVISADGHAVSGDITFTLTRAGTGQPVQQSAGAVATGTSGGVPVWVWIVAALVVLGAVLFFALRSGRTQEASRR